MRRLLTGSGVGRARACNLSMVLPVATSDVETADAGAGRAKHKYLLLDLPVLGKAKALELVPEEYRAACDAIDETLMPTAANWLAEVAMAFDPLSARAEVLAAGLSREASYDVAPAWATIVGTADLVGFVGDDTVVLLDLKTGFVRQGDPTLHDQMKTYAVMARATYGRPNVSVGFITLDDDNRPTWRHVALTTEQLDAHARVLFDLVVAGELHESELDAHEGEHCKRCPSFSRCPVKTQLARSLAVQDPRVDLTALTPETAAMAYERMAVMMELLEAVKDRLEEYVDTLPGASVPLSSGMHWDRRTKNNFAVRDLEKAKAELARIYGPDVAAAAVEVPAPKITSGSLEMALRLFVARTPGAKISKVESAARMQLIEANAAYLFQRSNFEKFKPKPLSKKE